jgi:hypothetical protein
MSAPMVKLYPSRKVMALAVSIVLAISAAVLAVDAIKACGPYLSLRPYLKRSFWLPMYFTFNNLRPADAPGGSIPYAGFSPEAAPKALAELRAAYLPLAQNSTQEQPQSIFEHAVRAAEQALAPGILTGKDLEEARLIDCKITLRMAERNNGNNGNNDARSVAKQKLEKFIASGKDRALISEARGWLARLFYLQKNYVHAALIYLDETQNNDSPLSRDTLASSLRWVYSEGEEQLWERAEEFFDTPNHALFLVNLVTNQEMNYRPPNFTERGEKILALLQNHPDLFKSGADSDALTMALMRTSLYMGNLPAASKYAAAIPKSSPLLQNPEFNWMTAIARFLQHDFAGAEDPLLRMLNASSAAPEDRATAAQALVGVYLKTKRNVDALHASFIQESQKPGAGGPDIVTPRMQMCSYCQNLELPYLLDIYLSEGELRTYLKKHPEPVGEFKVIKWDQPMPYSAPQIVQYSLAVRCARREKYLEAAKIFNELKAGDRAARMQELAALFTHSRNSIISKSDRLAALYDYGDYISSNPNQLFFNDLLWFRMQSYTFINQDRETMSTYSGLTRIERETILAKDRSLRDQQEERWKAFHVFEQVAKEAGHTDLGRKAAKKIIGCLGGIRTDRFGRDREIQNEIVKWKRWLNAKQP